MLILDEVALAFTRNSHLFFMHLSKEDKLEEESWYILSPL